MGIAAWQAVRISREKRAFHDLVTRPPPLRNRSGSRPLLQRDHPAIDPVAAFHAKAKRGMTDREIRWMVEDFQRLGLDRAPQVVSKELHRAFREKQQAWYARALDEALGLSDEQNAEVRQSMAGLLEHDFAIWPKRIKISGGPSEKSFEELWDKAGEPPTPDELRTMAADTTEAGKWLKADAYAPWNLCELTDAQTSLTLKPAGASGNTRQLVEDPFAHDPTPSWLVTGVFPKVETAPPSHPTAQPAIPENASAADFLGNASAADAPGAFVYPTEYEPPQYSTIATMHPLARLLQGTVIFQTTRDQAALADKNNEWVNANPLAQARLYQPAQLRIALLIGPQWADGLLQQLNDPDHAVPHMEIDDHPYPIPSHK